MKCEDCIAFATCRTIIVLQINDIKKLFPNKEIKRTNVYTSVQIRLQNFKYYVNTTIACDSLRDKHLGDITDIFNLDDIIGNLLDDYPNM